MSANDIVHILVAPPNTIETSLVKEAAAILNKEPYETRLLLSGKMPKLIAHYQSTIEAEMVAVRLKTLGLVVFICSDEKLRQISSASFLAHALHFGEKEVTFMNKGGQRRIMASTDVFLILKGKIQTSTNRDVINTRLKFSLPATLLTGGFPVWRKVKETTKDTAVEEVSFIRLYNRLSVDPQVEIFENYFDFSSLGTKIAPSSLTNLNSITLELREVFPQALYDDRLAETSVTSINTGLQGNNEFELNCRLIYMYYLTLSGPGSLQ
jgi:hypothetical protein